MIIECTKKLADGMKIKLKPYDATSTDSFYEWHANLFMFDRRKGVLLMMLVGKSSKSAVVINFKDELI